MRAALAIRPMKPALDTEVTHLEKTLKGFGIHLEATEKCVYRIFGTQGGIAAASSSRSRSWEKRSMTALARSRGALWGCPAPAASTHGSRRRRDPVRPVVLGKAPAINAQIADLETRRDQER